MTSFTPLSATIGGVLIGLASAILWLGNGRIAGISGIFGQLLPASRGAIWRAAFLVALVAGTWISAQLFPGLGVGGPGGEPSQLVEAPAGWGISTPVWIGLAGLLIGFGTRISNGCTSGHGVCGLARLSQRSVVAVGIFFTVAIATAMLTGVAR